MKDLTLIIPAKNEAESLPKVLADLKNFNCKILVSLQKDDEDTINAIKPFDFLPWLRMPYVYHLLNYNCLLFCSVVVALYLS